MSAAIYQPYEEGVRRDTEWAERQVAAWASQARAWRIVVIWLTVQALLSGISLLIGLLTLSRHLA